MPVSSNLSNASLTNSSATPATGFSSLLMGLGVVLMRDEMGTDTEGLDDDELRSGRMPALRQQRRIVVASTSSHATLASLMASSWSIS